VCLEIEEVENAARTREGGPVKTEADPLDPNPPGSFSKTLAAIRYLEDAVRRTVGLHALPCAMASSTGQAPAVTSLTDCHYGHELRRIGWRWS
jgi:hypothetical protein